MSTQKIKALLCTWKGIDTLKRFVAFGAGAGVLVSAVLSILNLFASLFDLIGFIRQLWNCLFGGLMILLQLQWVGWITRRFGFLAGWFGRGMFFLLCLAT